MTERESADAGQFPKDSKLSERLEHLGVSLEVKRFDVHQRDTKDFMSRLNKAIDEVVAHDKVGRLTGLANAQPKRTLIVRFIGSGGSIHVDLEIQGKNRHVESPRLDAETSDLANYLEMLIDESSRDV